MKQRPKAKRFRKAARDANSGQYTSIDYARENPSTTVVETYEVEPSAIDSSEIASLDE